MWWFDELPERERIVEAMTAVASKPEFSRFRCPIDVKGAKSFWLPAVPAEKLDWSRHVQEVTLDSEQAIVEHTESLFEEKFEDVDTHPLWDIRIVC